MGRPPPPETLGLPQARPVADQKGLCSRPILHKAVQQSLWDDALQQKASDAAIESFWRCKFVELWLFVWSAWFLGVPAGPRGFPVVSQGRARGSAEVQGGSRGPRDVMYLP